MSSFVFKGAIFDLDGVITNTAEVHSKAWKKTFDAFLKKRAEETQTQFVPFTNEGDYIPFVDGKPRYEGVKSFLESRNFDLPFGDVSDAPGKETVCGIGNSKNDAFRSVIIEEGIEVFETTIKLVKEFLAKGIKVGVASSSMNCRFILEESGLIDLFETVVAGIRSKELDLKGKPAPDIFITAAKELGLEPNDCVMVEDAISGVQAGRNGNFALVLGIARNGDKEVLLANGADIVVTDIGEISYQDIEAWFSSGIDKDSWLLNYYGFEPKEEKLRETLTTVGNGYFGTRGCFEGEDTTDDFHYPGTYIAGLYNKIPTEVHGKQVYNNDFVNCPNWLMIELKIGEADYLKPLREEVLEYKQQLDLKNAVMIREISVKDKEGRITAITTSRIVSMAQPHIGAIKYSITPKNYSEKIAVKSSIDSDVINFGVPRYRDLNSKHLDVASESFEDGINLINVRTNSSNIDIFMAAKTTAAGIEKEIIDNNTVLITAKENNSYVIEKVVSIYTSKDEGVGDARTEAKDALFQAGSFDELLVGHKAAWERLWAVSDMLIDGDRFCQKTIRLHIYHLLVAASLHNTKIDAGMTARGLHGEAYRGHVFWDELYILPFYNLHFPEISKSLLMYRYRRLNDAKEHATEHGYLGAMYPWQTADDGKEETQVIHYNPVSGNWDPDLSCRQRHVSLAIAYNVWQYFNTTNDIEFLKDYGLEMMLEISRFWASIAEFDKADGKYHIKGVMGPDEFHERYDEGEAGLKDNAYTNILTSWVLEQTLNAYKKIDDISKQALKAKIGFSETELEEWKKIAKGLAVVINEQGLISQFDGYFNLQDLDWDHYRAKYGDIHRMDRILKSEGNSPDKFKVAKQADVLMLFYALSPEQVKNVLATMGYEVGDVMEFVSKNYEYYVHRTSHGSTLSHIVHSAILQLFNAGESSQKPEFLDKKKEQWEWFLHALESDVNDTQGGTTQEGIHCGVMAGTIDLVLKGFAGLVLNGDCMEIAPSLPKHWRKLDFKIRFRGGLYRFEITCDKVTVSCVEKGEKVNLL
jgi:beta-phosphoglucomutase family hydrolase